MPLWDESELRLLASKCYSAGVQWEERYKILGGVPRFVLEFVEDSPSKLIEQACAECELDLCVKAIGANSSISEKSKVVHRLVHITSVSPFTESSVQFASTFALDIIVRKKGAEAKGRMQELLASCEENPLIASLCGYIFEGFVLDLLRKGHTFKCRQLVGGKKKLKPGEFQLVIPASERRTADRIEDGQTFHQLHVPRTKNFTAIDAWIPGVGAFQVTVSKHHGIRRGEELKDGLIKLGPEGNKLYWCLPPPCYSDFSKKAPHDIDQYAVLVEYPSLP